MKKHVFIALVVLVFLSVSGVWAATYDNNEFQRKSRAYSELATKSYDEGEYDKAVEYAVLAEEQAKLSAEFISKMIARSQAETLLYKAHTRLNWARDIKAERFFPSAYSDASLALSNGDTEFKAENWSGASALAQQALDALSVVKEIIPLPAFYQVELWESNRDCLWNIAANPAVYGNPLAWEKLYEANRSGLKRPSNPNLLMPGMIVTIPSIKGEFREGTYDPSIKYEPFSSQVQR